MPPILRNLGGRPVYLRQRTAETEIPRRRATCFSSRSPDSDITDLGGDQVSEEVSPLRATDKPLGVQAFLKRPFVCPVGDAGCQPPPGHLVCPRVSEALCLAGFGFLVGVTLIPGGRHSLSAPTTDYQLTRNSQAPLSRRREIGLACRRRIAGGGKQTTRK